MSADTVTPDLEHAHAMSPRYYSGEATLALEQRAVFAHSWQLVAHRGQLAEPGDHVVGQVAGVPILLVRGEDGVLRGFPNICRHRGGPLALCDGKGLRALRCKYHGWTYTLDGQLRAATEMQDALDFNVADVHLPPLQVREWQGLVFVALDAGVPPFDAVYGGIAERIAPIDLSVMHYFRRINYEMDCNWKIYVENYVEGYHLPHVHPGLSRALDYRSYHTELFPWHSLQCSPLRDSGVGYGTGEAFYYFVYPNVMLNITPGRLQTNVILPLGPSRCLVVFDYYYAPDEDTRARIDGDQAFSDEVQGEDAGICEAVQKGLASGYYTPGRLNPRRESGVWHFQNLMRAAYARAAAESPCTPAVR
jgi:choline monooxygenase